MTEVPETRESLLLQVKNPKNREAWEQFARIYHPVIYRLARQRGLQDADALDLAQLVLMAVSSSIGRWETNGKSIRFRHWLRRVARNAIVNALSRKPHDRGAGGTSVQQLLNEHPQLDDDTEKLIEHEYRRQLYLQAADTVRADVRPATWQAFELTMIDGKCIESTARELGKPVGVVYTARSRVMRRLREAVRKLEGAGE